MVDGRLLPKSEAEALRGSILELVRDALTELGGRNPDDALRVLDSLRAYGYAQLEGERPRWRAARAARFPPPAPAAWPEVALLRLAAERQPDACRISAPVENVYFTKVLEDAGLPLPEELIALYAACDGFELSCAAATYLPVFGLLPSRAMEACEAEGKWGRRAAAFHGGDEVQLSIYRDRKKSWRLVFEYEYRAIGEKPLDVRELLRFGVARMNGPLDVLEQELSWDRFFGIAER